MKPAIKSNIVFFSLCITSIFIISACSQNIQETNKYYNPAWMANGKIICVHSYEKVAIGSSSSGIYGSSGGTILAQNNYLTVIDPTTNTEHNVLDLPWGTYPELNCSPKGTYLAMHTNGLDIYQLNNMQKIATIKTNSEIEFFDWAPSEDMLLITSSGNYIYSLNGTIIKNLNSIHSISGWKYGDELAGHKENALAINFLNNNDEIIFSSPENFSLAFRGYFPDGQSYLGNFVKVSVPSFNIIESYDNLKTVLDAEDWYIHLINPINSNQLLFTNDHNINPNYDKNIFLINLDGTNKQRLR